MSISSVRTIALNSLFTGCLIALAGPALAAQDAHGQVNMNGSIVASACTLGVDSLDQHIDLGSVPMNVVARDGQGPDKPFNIRLEDCEMFRPGQWDFNSVRVTFDGPRDEVPHLIRLMGDAQGIGLLIKDNVGRTVVPGETLAALPLNDGVVELHYTLAVEKNHQALFAGHYRTGVRFKVEYE